MYFNAFPKFAWKNSVYRGLKGTWQCNVITNSQIVLGSQLRPKTHSGIQARRSRESVGGWIIKDWCWRLPRIVQYQSDEVIDRNIKTFYGYARKIRWDITENRSFAANTFVRPPPPRPSIVFNFKSNFILCAKSRSANREKRWLAYDGIR